MTGLAKGAAAPGKETVGSVSIKALYEIARSKQQVCPGDGLRQRAPTTAAAPLRPCLPSTLNLVTPHAAFTQFDPIQKLLPLEGICKCLIGQARSMGIKVTR